MNDENNPLQVQRPPFEIIPNPSPEQISDLSGQWRNWMANEGNRAALLQFGVSLMQPMGFGQTVAGHVGQAIGSTGELASRRQAQELKEREVGSKEELRAAQAGLAESRAARAGEGAGRAADRLAFEREKLGMSQLLGEQRLGMQRMARLQQARRDYDAAMFLLPQNQRPSFETWLQQSGLGALASEGSRGEGGTEPTMPGAPAPTAPTAGAPPISQLKEGVGIRFSNGQVWTLENGIPKRVR